MSQAIARMCAFVVAAAAVATPAFAQNDPKFALITSVPAANAGFQWEVTRRFALRVDGTYNSSHEEQDYVLSPQQGLGGTPLSLEQRIHVETSTRSTTINLSAILTVRQTDRMRLYLAPRVLLGFSNQKLTETTGATEATTSTGTFGTLIFAGSPARTNETEQSSTSVGGGASFGAEGRINDALALFTEFGLTYSRSDNPSSLGISLSSSRSMLDANRTAVNTRAVVGVMFRF